MATTKGPGRRFTGGLAGPASALTAPLRWQVDAPAVARLVLALPWFVVSLAVLVLVTTPPRSIAGSLDDLRSLPGKLSGLTWVVVVGWLLSGAVVLWQPLEAVLARLVSGLRSPSPGERAILTEAWQDVGARAGVPLERYSLWIQPSSGINATAAAGHTIAVTRRALELPRDQLRAVLAHELGHHLDGYPTASRLAHWYSIPARIALQVTLVVVRIVRMIYDIAAGLLVGIVSVVAPGGGCLLALVDLLVRGVWSLVSLAVFLALAWIPAALAWFDRQAEIHADRAAAQLGYGPALIELLEHCTPEDDRARARASRIDLLLYTHPSMRTRIRHLRSLEARAL